MKDLRGKIALLTGGSRGIGPVIAQALVAEGVAVALVARSEKPLREAADALSRPDVPVIAVPGDITSHDGRTAVIEQTESRLGSIDILVNNAGIENANAFDQQTETAVCQTIDTNLTAALLLARQVLPGMLARRWGHIINIASMSGKVGLPYNAVYSATKAGLIEWTHAMQFELDGTGVAASVICPGFISGVGKFARDFGDLSLPLGNTSPDQVATAVVEAIAHSKTEIIAASGPLRPLLAMNELSPKLGKCVLDRLGVAKMFRSLS